MDQPAVPTPATPMPPPPPRTPRRWWRRILWGVAAVVGFVLLIVALLPTIISLPFVERMVSQRASALFDGEMQLEGFSIGWLGPLRIDKLVLRDPGAEHAPVLMELRGLRHNRSLLQLIFSSDRAGTLTIGGLDVHLARRPDGTFNFDAYIPPPDPNAEPEPPAPAEPFVLDLEQLLPTLEMPVPSFALEARNINIRVDDFATTHPTTAQVRVESASLGWAGETQPIRGKVHGAIDWDARTMSVVGELTIEKWIDQSGTTTLGSARLRAKATSNHEPVLEATAQMTDGISASARLAIHANEFNRLMPEGLPTVRGTLYATASLVPEGDLQRISISLRADQFVLGNLPPPSRGDTPVTHVLLEADALVHPESFERQDVNLSLSTSFLGLEAQEIATQNGVYTANLRAYISVHGLLGELARWGYSPPNMPEMPEPARLTINAKLEHQDGMPMTGEASIEWLAVRVHFPSTAMFPPNFIPRRDQADLTPYNFLHRMTFDLPTTETAVAHYSTVEGPLKGTIDVRRDADGAITVDHDLALDIASMLDAVNADFVTSPTIALSGTPNHQGRLVYTGDEVRFDVTGDWQGLGFESDMIPGVALHDNPSYFAKGAVVLAPEIDAQVDAGLSADWMDATVAAHWGGRLHGANAKLNIDLADMAPIIAPFMGDLALPMEGGVALSIQAVEPAPGVYTWDVSAEPSDGFRVDYAEGMPALEAFDFHTAGQWTGTEDGGGELVVEALSAGLANALSVDLPLNMTMTPESMTLAGRVDASLDYGVLMEWMMPWLEEVHGVLAEGIGETTITGDWAGTAATGETMTWPEPITATLSIHTAIEELIAEMTDARIELQGLEDQRDWSLRVDPSDPESLRFTETSALQMVGLVANDMVTVQDMAWETALELKGLEDLTASVGKFEIPGVLVKMPDAEIVIEGITASLLAKANLATMEVVLERATAGIDGVLAAEMNAVYTGTRFETEGTMTLEDAGALTTMMAPDPLAGIVDRLRGGATMRFQAAGDLAPGPDGATAAANLVGSLDAAYEGIGMRLPGLISVDDANGSWQVQLANGDATVQFTNGLSLVPDASLGIPAMAGIRLDGAASLDEGGNFALEPTALEFPSLGFAAAIAGRLDDVYTVAANAPAEGVTVQQQLDFLSAMGFEMTMGIDQAMAPLGSTPWLDEGLGTAEFGVHTGNTPGRQARIYITTTTEQLGLDFADMVHLRGMAGTLPLRLAILHGAHEAIRQSVGAGGFYFEELKLSYPPYGLPIRSMRMDVTARTADFSVRIMSSDFAGGQLNATGRLYRSEADPMLELEFAVTGFDTIHALPHLTSMATAQRRVDLFGTLRWRIAPDPTMTGVMEQIDLRMNVERLGPDVLRGFLKAMNEESYSPGIQSTLAALRFSRPESATLTIQQGLADARVQMISPPKVRYTIPLLERTNLADLTGVYGSSELDPMLALLRLTLAACLAHDSATLAQILTSGDSTQ